MTYVADRYQAVRRAVADAADVSGRSAAEVTVVAVTKTVGIEAIRHAIDAGVRDFGENRVQEFLGKYGLFPDVNWHFIGTLQTNKVKDVVGRSCLIHSVDSVRLLDTLDRKAAEVGLVQAILLEINVAGEQSKHGFSPGEVSDVLAEASHLRNVLVRGLMTMAPLTKAEEVRWVFRELRELRDSLRESLHDGVELDELSMGMSNDYRIAVEEGATIVRIGRAIFGR
jgi:pyridoxal phosphate enzyme (YggS family)